MSSSEAKATVLNSFGSQANELQAWFVGDHLVGNGGEL